MPHLPLFAFALLRHCLGLVMVLLWVQAQAAELPDATTKQQDVTSDTAIAPVNSTAVTSAEPATQLPEVSVKADKIKDHSINPTQAITTITAQDLERAQPGNIFDAIRTVPGVSINGGPRPSGMSFSIRGYADNEDVTVKVDGVPKGFEKYRMGGTFIEPELLKSIEVQRGPQIASGSGSLGGTIIATTKDAADLLAPGQRYGARVKFGYANNNDEYSRSYLVYGRPDDRVDILFNYSNRQSNNITRADGSKLESSAIESISKLLKVSLFPIDSVQLTTSVVSFKDSGLQPYDATGGQPGSFGNVVRSIDDLTWSQTLKFKPDLRWIDLKAIYGRGHTDLHDLILPGMSSINASQPNCNGIIYLPNPADRTRCNGDLNDHYRYQATTIDVSNVSELFRLADIRGTLLMGYQYNESKREVSRFLENPVRSQNLYPQGFNASASPGTKIYEAYYLQPKLEIGRFSIMPGYRKDHYRIKAAGGTLALLEPDDQADKIKFEQESTSLGLAYELLPKLALQRVTLYANYGQGFRPPLIDELFTQGIFSRCAGFLMANGPASEICGDLYRPQTSESTEAGVSYQNARLFNLPAQLTAKLNFFHIHTSHLLSSLREVNGAIVQDGWETRNGVEFENTLTYRSLYARTAYSRTSGKLYDGQEFVPLYTVPGNALNVMLGAQLSSKWDVNVGYRKISERNVVTSGGNGTPLEFGMQDGYELWNAGIHYAPTRNLGLRLVGENLTNNEYRLDGAFGGSIGTFGPGRNLRFIAELTY